MVTAPTYSAWSSAFLVCGYSTMVCVALWFLALYVIVLSQASRGSVLQLNRLERRLSERGEIERKGSHHAWVRFRTKHLAAARAVQRANKLIFLPVVWVAALALVGLLVFAGLIAFATMSGYAPRSWDGVAFALAFFSPVPSLLTALVQRALWHRRARSEWEVVLLGDQLASDSASQLDQDYVARHSDRILSALGRRLPRGGARRGETAEGRLWVSKVQTATQMRARMATSDLTERRDWSGWVSRWLDRIADSFDDVSDPTSVPAKSTLDPLPAKLPHVVGLGLLIAICCGFSGVGIALALFSSGFDASPALKAWDSTAGRLATLVGLIAAVLAIASYRRGRSVGDG